MTSLQHDERRLTARPGNAVVPSQRHSIRRYDNAVRRLARLERLADDPEVYADIVERGRYLRLCAAIAWASDNVERARYDLFAKTEPRLH